MTREEKEAQEELINKMKNEEFEKQNSEFCNQFRDDLEKRRAAQAAKEKQVESKQRHNKRLEWHASFQHVHQYLVLSLFL